MTYAKGQSLSWSVALAVGAAGVACGPTAQGNVPNGSDGGTGTALDSGSSSAATGDSGNVSDEDDGGPGTTSTGADGTTGVIAPEPAHPIERLRVFGDESSERLGALLFRVSDLDGDGVEELAMSQGDLRVLVVYGGIEGAYTASELLADGRAFAIDHPGWIDLTSADLDGDRTAELVIAAGPVGKAQVNAEISFLTAPARGGLVDLTQPPYPSWEGDELRLGNNFGAFEARLSARRGVVRVGDVTGDGHADLAVGLIGAAWVVAGPLGEVSTTSFQELAASGRAFRLDASADATVGLLSTQDVTADGMGDLAVQVRDELSLLPGPLEGPADIDEVACGPGSLTSTWVHPGIDLPSTLRSLGDVSGEDGAQDAIWGVPGAGHAIVLHGSAADACSALRFKTRLEEADEEGDGTAAAFGTAVSGLDDFDGDGRHDVLVGNPAGGDSLGRVWLMLGNVAFDAAAAEHHADDLPTYVVQTLAKEGRAIRVDAEQPGSEFGFAAASGRFVDPTTPSFAVSAPAHDDAARDAGMVMVFARPPP